MRKIEFIAPVDSMRGNLSGNQDLKYAKNNNPAFDAPDGKQYAKNFQTRFIGAKRASDGLKYFNVRTKSAVQINDESKKAMACLGGTQAIYSAIIKQQPSAIPQITSYFNWYITTFGHGPSVGGKRAKSVKHWIFLMAYRCLNNKENNFSFAGPSTGGSVTIHNPWSVQTPITGAIVLNLSTDIIIKFWMQLANDAVQYDLINTIEGMPWVIPFPAEGKTINILTSVAEVWSHYIDSSRNTAGFVLSSNHIKPSTTSDYYLEYRDDDETDWAAATGTTKVQNGPYQYRWSYDE